jgi:ABC-type branched-subunit amino acid transport system permease subunit
MTLAAALLFDSTFFSDASISGGTEGLDLQAKWLGTSAFFNFDGHALFILCMVVLSLAVAVVLLVRKGTVGRNLAAMRGSEMAAAGLGINLTKQRVVVFALAGAIAGFGGVLVTIQLQQANMNDWNYNYSLIFIVLVVTTGVATVEGAIQAGIGFYVISQIATYLPSRWGGGSLVIVLFAFGALQFARHPEGVLEFQKRRSTLWFEHHLFDRRPEGFGAPLSASGADG